MSVFKVNNPDKIGSFRSVIDVNRYLGIRIGDLKYTTCNSDVNNWLICDGRSLSRTAYSELFSVIGTDFGANDSETFKLPDFRGRVLGGIGSGSGLTSRDLGDSVGAETHTLTTNQIPSHLHTGTTDSAGAHTHTSNATGGQGNYGLALADGNNTAISTDSSLGELNLMTLPQALTINSNGAHTHTFTSGNTGGGQSHNNMQPTLFGGNVLILSKVADYNTLPALDLKLLIEY